MREKTLNILQYSCLITFLFINPIFAKDIKTEVSYDKETSSLIPSQENEIIKIIAQQKNKYDLKSVIFGVWEDNQPIISGALGESMTGVPAGRGMQFRIGGVAETFLTTILLQLVDEGKVSLEDKISKWSPDLPHSDLVSLRMLANSTSGYPDYEKSPKFVKAFEKDVFKMWTTKEILEYAFASPLLFEPGTQWNYSHTNYVVLGDVLEKITQQPIAQLLHEKIFHKLDLRQTTFSITAEMPFHALHSFSSDRGVYEDSTFWSPSWTSFSGSMTSNIEDLGKWAQAFGTGALLSKKSHEAMITPVRIEKNNPKLGFGMGFAIVNSWLVQNPTFGGYSGFFAYLPSKKLSIIVYNTLNPKTSADVNYSQQIVGEIVKKIAPDDLMPEVKK